MNTNKNNLKEYYESFITSQKHASPDLLPLLKKYQESTFLRPLPEHQKNAFRKIADFIGDSTAPLILDSCCGTGLSTLNLAQNYPEALVIGIDKSAARITRGPDLTSNCLVVRGDIYDLWSLFIKEKIHFIKHFMFYPNPWPKAGHLKRRFYAHPTFLGMSTLSDYFELRSNWPLFIEEASIAFNFAGLQVNTAEPAKDRPPMSLFEKKYQDHGVKLYLLVAQKLRG